MISLDDVSFTYPGRETPALSGISLTVKNGERLAIIGSSGSGKSTLGRLLAGLLKPSQGRVLDDMPDSAKGSTDDHRGGRRLDSSRIDNRCLDSGRLDGNRLGGSSSSSKSVAIVFQNPETQLVGATVEEDVALGPENLGLASEEIRRRVDWALEALGISHLATRPVDSLSGGEKQRVAVAGALAMHPSCLVLDEASAMLHPEAKRQLEAALTRIRRHGVSIVQITHDMDEAARADRIALLHRGKLVAVGSPGAVLGDEALLLGCGLEPPQSVQLALALRRLGVDLPGSDAGDLSGEVPGRCDSSPGDDPGRVGDLLLDIPSLADAIVKAVTR